MSREVAFKVVKAAAKGKLSLIKRGVRMVDGMMFRSIPTLWKGNKEGSIYRILFYIKIDGVEKILKVSYPGGSWEAPEKDSSKLKNPWDVLTDSEKEDLIVQLKINSFGNYVNIVQGFKIKDKDGKTIKLKDGTENFFRSYPEAADAIERNNL